MWQKTPSVLTVACVPGSQILDAVSFNVLLCLFYELWEIRNRYAIMAVRNIPWKKRMWNHIPNVREPPFGIPASVCDGCEESVLAVLPDKVALFLRLRSFELRTTVFLDNLLHDFCGIVDRSRRRALQLEEKVVRHVVFVPRCPRDIRCVNEC
jgi:hypothetical protein